MPRPDQRRLPEPTLARLHRYERALRALRRQGMETISSERLGQESRTAPPLVRKDLSYVGATGQRGVGYDVARLLAMLEEVLGPDQPRPLLIVGAGNLGVALAGYAGFEMQGYRLVGAFDTNPSRVGHRLQGVLIRHMDDLPEVVAETGAQLAILAVPAARAQEAADQCIAAGLRGLLNFAPAQLHTPPHVIVRQVDLTEELQILSYQLSGRDASATGEGGP